MTPAQPPPRHVAIVGGGIGGLAAARFLTRARVRVTLYEGADRFGGLGTFFDHRGDSLDRYYHVILPTDDELLSLLDDLGLREHVYWRPTSMGFIYGRQLYPMNTALDLLRFRPATFVDRLRLGLTALYAANIATSRGLDDETVASWLTRLSGRRAFDRLWRPLLEAKFGEAYQQIPALWYWASFRREKGTRKEVKGYVRGGYKGITDKLVAAVSAEGGTLHLNTPVERLDLDQDGKPLVTVGGQARAFDAVVLTLPMTTLRQIAEGGQLASRLEQADAKVDYQGVLNVLVMLRRQLSPHYWMPVVDSGVPFRGIVETTRTIDLADTGGRHLVYLLNYLHRTDPRFQRPDEEVAREYLDGLFSLMPDLRREDVDDVAVFRAPFVEPLYTPGYGRRKPPPEIVPGRVYLATTAQVYPQVTSWNSSTQLARQTVDHLLSNGTSSA